MDTLDNIIGEILNDQDFERLKYIRGAENEVQKYNKISESLFNL